MNVKTNPIPRVIPLLNVRTLKEVSSAFVQIPMSWQKMGKHAQVKWDTNAMILS